MSNDEIAKQVLPNALEAYEASFLQQMQSRGYGAEIELEGITTVSSETWYQFAAYLGAAPSLRAETLVASTMLLDIPARAAQIFADDCVELLESKKK